MMLPPSRGCLAVRRTRHGIVGLGLLLLAALPRPSHAARPDVLWAIVHNQCVPALRQGQGDGPCAAVVPAGGGLRGYAVLKDHHGASQFLLIPTARITGIESPLLWRGDAPNYFAAAWQQRGRVGEALGKPLPRDVLSLSVNSAHGRSQEQLHIHIDCIREDVQTAVARVVESLSDQPQTLTLPPWQHRYKARWLTGPELQVDPFVLIAADPQARADMGAQTLLVMGADSPTRGQGFVLLSGRYDPAHGDRGNAEELQDHLCLLARPADQRVLHGAADQKASQPEQ